MVKLALRRHLNSNSNKFIFAFSSEFLECVNIFSGQEQTEISNLSLGLEKVEIAWVLATESLWLSQETRCAGRGALDCGGTRLQGLEQNIILHGPTGHVIRYLVLAAYLGSAPKREECGIEEIIWRLLFNTYDPCEGAMVQSLFYCSLY